MYLTLTPTLCEPPSLQSPLCPGDSGAKSLFAPFLKLLDNATSGSHQHSTLGGYPEMTPISQEHGDGAHTLPDEIQEGTLLFILSNPLLLSLTADYLSPLSTVNLAATCRSFRSLVYGTPGVFRRLDLSEVRSAQFDVCPIDQGGQMWRNVQLDENITEDESA